MNRWVRQPNPPPHLKPWFSTNLKFCDAPKITSQGHINIPGSLPIYLFSLVQKLRGEGIMLIKAKRLRMNPSSFISIIRVSHQSREFRLITALLYSRWGRYHLLQCAIYRGNHIEFHRSPKATANATLHFIHNKFENIIFHFVKRTKNMQSPTVATSL